MVYRQKNNPFTKTPLNLQEALVEGSLPASEGFKEMKKVEGRDLAQEKIQCEAQGGKWDDEKGCVMPKKENSEDSTNISDVVETASTVATVASVASDIRLKENIEKTGVSPSGIPIYEFNYIGQNDRYSGTMAQDLLKMGIDAVIEDESGYYKVNYNNIDINMYKI
tara:strand:- start:189 stop:686 length:498 start_codon:yes stop_codon:yes gene_type:complete